MGHLLVQFGASILSHATLLEKYGIQVQEKDKRSFEALSAIVYRPEHLQAVDQHHRQIMEKTCVISAMDDNLHTIKAYLLNAAHKQGISHETTVTALADGAKNCWSVLSALTPECETLECILDWFHIAQKFQNELVASWARSKFPATM